MYTLVVVPCGKKKIWDKKPDTGPTKAKDVYLGPTFKVYSEYPVTFGNEWLILSAKYGFIEPNFIIPENYNVTFNDPSTNPISLEELKKQVDQKLRKYEGVVALGSTTYASIVSKAFEHTGITVLMPTAGLSIGYALGKVKDAIRSGKPFSQL